MSDINKFYYKKAKLQQLKGFCSVIEQGSIKRAGIELSLDSSTVSLQIKSLENDFDTDLIYKTDGKILPTKNGLILYEKASKIVKMTDELFNTLMFDKNKNYINIAVSPIFIEYITDYLFLFDNKVNINLFVVLDKDIIDSVLKNNIDVAIYSYGNNFTPSELKLVKLIEYHYYNVSYKVHKSKIINIEDFFNNIDSNINFKNYFSFDILKKFLKNTDIAISMPDLYLKNCSNELILEKTNKKNYILCLYKKNNYNQIIHNFITFLSNVL